MNDNSSLLNLKKLKKSDEGMTSVITTVLIIAIVLGLIIGPYLTIVVPEQIKDNEAAHLDDVSESFQDLRAAINNEITQGTPNMVLSTRIKLGTDDENLFVIGGSGELKVDPSASLISVYSYADPLSIYARGAGIIKYSSKNLYKADKDFIYESSGVVSSQRDVTVMTHKPDFDLTRRRVIKYQDLDPLFGELDSGDTQLKNIYIVNTISSNITITNARISWVGGNATALTSLNIGSNPVEWNGTAASNINLNLTSTFSMGLGTEPISMTFNSDIREARIRIELFTAGGKTLTATYLVTTLDTVAHPYDFEVISENAKRFVYKNICNRVTTINNISLAWTGNATLYRINIQNHGGDVWTVGVPGVSSPVNIDLSTKSVFNPGEDGEVICYFQGLIDGEDLNIKFFAENSTNFATAELPINLNETFINGSLSTITLVTDTGNTITSAGKSSKVIKTTLLSAENNRYLWEAGEVVVFEIITSNGEAWLSYLNTSLARKNELIWDYDNIGSYPGDFYLLSEEVSAGKMKVSLVLNSIYQLDCKIGVIEVDIG